MLSIKVCFNTCLRMRKIILYTLCTLFLELWQLIDLSIIDIKFNKNSWRHIVVKLKTVVIAFLLLV